MLFTLILYTGEMKRSIKPFSVTTDITICPSPDNYSGLYLRGNWNLSFSSATIFFGSQDFFLPLQTVHTLMKYSMMAFHQFTSVKKNVLKISAAVHSKMLRRGGHRLKTHVIDLKTQGSNLGPLCTRQIVYILHYFDIYLYK